MTDPRREPMSACCDCGSTIAELRPYGPGAAPICFDCMKASPEREIEAERNYGALLNAAEAIGGGVSTIGGEDGPRPGFNP